MYNCVLHFAHREQKGLGSGLCGLAAGLWGAVFLPASESRFGRGVDAIRLQVFTQLFSVLDARVGTGHVFYYIAAITFALALPAAFLIQKAPAPVVDEKRRTEEKELTRLYLLRDRKTYQLVAILSASISPGPC